jgi:hypothetical protein
MKKMSNWFGCLVLVATVGLLPYALAQSAQPTPATPAAQAVPVIDGGIGRCSLELTVTTPDGKPAAAAKVKVHIAYAFGGFHKLDLEAGTNSEGKVKFTGLPSRVRRPPLEFHASKDQLEATVTYDPATECHATHDVTLAKPAPPASQ